MSQRIPLDRRSFKLGLSAFFERLHRRGVRANTVDWDEPQTLPELLQIQEKTKGDQFDLDTVMDRVVKIAWRELRTDGAGVWLFTNNEIFYRAGAGEASNDERLRLTVLSMLAASCQLNEHSETHLGKPFAACVPSGAGPAPSYAKSLLKPISQGQRIAGVLAVFSSEAGGFTERDADKIQFLADLLAQALGRFADRSSQYVALEPATMLQLVEGMISALRNMLSSDDRSYNSTAGFPHATTRREREPVPLRLPDDPATPVIHDEANVKSREGRAASEKEAAEPSTLRPQDRSKWDGAVAVVKNRSLHAYSAVTVASVALANRVEQLGRQVWQAARSRTPRPLSQPDLRQPPRFLFGVWARARANSKVWLPSRPRLFALASVLAVALMTIALLISKSGHYFPGQTRASTLPTTTPEKGVAADADGSADREIAQSDEVATVAPLEATAVLQATTPSPIGASHLRVTDRSTQDALRTLSRYELAGLRRRALYGDDFAELLIGMAYETGRGLQQNCNTAAQWVMKAAAQGNAAAEYNLGLRYRDGDGVLMNQDAALKWLRKAAERHIPGAEAALMATAAR